MKSDGFGENASYSILAEFGKLKSQTTTKKQTLNHGCPTLISQATVISNRLDWLRNCFIPPPTYHTPPLQTPQASRAGTTHIDLLTFSSDPPDPIIQLFPALPWSWCTGFLPDPQPPRASQLYRFRKPSMPRLHMKNPSPAFARASQNLCPAYKPTSLALLVCFLTFTRAHLTRPGNLHPPGARYSPH